MPAPDDILASLERGLDRPLPLTRRLTAPQLFAGSYLVLVLAGTLLLYLLPGIYTGERLGLLDALFTATSAVCLNGLEVVPTGTAFTPAGQAVLLVLIQLGTLTVLTMTALLMLAIRNRVAGAPGDLASTAEATPGVRARSMLRTILLTTLVVEAAGTLLLYVIWQPRLGVAGALWPALFHAVSAFGNAGFSTFPDELSGFTGHTPTLLTIAALVVAGGLGSLVLTELRLRYRRRGRRIRRLSVHSRLVLATTALLLGAGTLLFLLFEAGNALADHDLPARLSGALFFAAMPRTGGFITAEYALLTPASLFLTIGLMMIGGSPGSAAGGMKTTTFAVLALLALARMRGYANTDAFRRTIPRETVQRAVGLVVVVIGTLAVAILVLLHTEFGATPYSVPGGGFMDVTFEAVSAFNMVGLSTGITPALSTGGRITIVLLMLIGRLGPLTLVASMIAAASRRRVRLRHATEDVIIG